MAYILNEKISGLEPYETIQGDFRIRLDANESFIEIPESTKNELLEGIAELSLNRYPDPRARRVCSLFASYYNVDPDCVSAFNGSDELLFLISTCFLMKGEKAVFLAPDFSMYRFYSELGEARTAIMQKNSYASFTAEDVISFVNAERARLLIFSNPCNPTGVGIERQEVIKIIEGCPDCLVAVDEAYMEFWDQSVIDLVCNYDNLMVLKTCSKAFRMAGIRCGFCVANKTLTDALLAVKSPYNVNSMTQTAAAAILSHPGELDAAIAHIKSSAASLKQELSDMAAQFPDKLSVRDTCANFSVIEMPGDSAKRMYEALKKEGILVRCFGSFLRVTAGSDEENAEFIRAFENNLF